MKKLSILLFLVLFVFVGCSKNPTLVLETQEDISQPIEISSSELTSMMDDDESFFLYISSVTCSSCIEFRPILLQFIEEHRFVVYQIESDSSFPTSNTLIPYEFTPTIVLVSNGKVVVNINQFRQSTPFSSVEELNKFLFKTIVKNPV
jgi:predicted bacteriocin transport accessory protein